jgi:hypothetical protein
MKNDLGLLDYDTSAFWNGSSLVDPKWKMTSRDVRITACLSDANPEEKKRGKETKHQPDRDRVAECPEAPIFQRGCVIHKCQ